MQVSFHSWLEWQQKPKVTEGRAGPPHLVLQGFAFHNQDQRCHRSSRPPGESKDQVC